MGIGVGKVGGSSFQTSFLINTFVACHNKFEIRIEKGPMTESVIFFSKHDI